MGLGVTWETIEGRKMYQFIDNITQSRAALYSLWANIHYGLLNAAAVADVSAKGQADGFAAAYLRVAWQGESTDAILDRDIATVNLGCARLGEVLKDRGYGDTANARFLLYVSPLYKNRLLQAQRQTTANIGVKTSAGASSVAGQAWSNNVDLRFSFNSNITAAKGLLVLPGNKIQNAVYLQELGLSRQDQDSLNELQAYWTAFGAAIGDNDQCAQLSFSS